MLALLLAVFVTACGDRAAQNSGQAQDERKPGTQETDEGIAGEKEGKSGNVTAEEEDTEEGLAVMLTQTESILPGILLSEAPLEGNYKSGSTVVFEDCAYTAWGDGIYEIKGGSVQQLTESPLPYDLDLCTDGYLLYYMDIYGTLWELDLTDEGRGRIVAQGFEGACHVIGAGKNDIYIRTQDTYEEESGILETFGSVYSVSLKDGEQKLLMQNAYGGCGGGYTYVRESGFDFGPGELRIYDFQGNEVVHEQRGGNVCAAAGTVWYSVQESANSPGNMDDSGDWGGEDAMLSLYRMEPDGPALTMERGCTGFRVSGFLLTVTGLEGDSWAEYYDLRTMQQLPDGLLDTDEDIFWESGFLCGGHAYFQNWNGVSVVTDDGLQSVFEMPSSNLGVIPYFCDDMILLDGFEGEYYIFPLQPEQTLHTVSLCAGRSAEGVEGTDVSVMAYASELNVSGAYVYPALSESLESFTRQSAQLARADAKECLELVETLAEDGFVDPSGDFSAACRAYIQRADTRVVSLMQHRSMDNGVNNQALDIKTGYNYDTLTGKELALGEVVTDLSALSEVLVEKLRELFPAQADSVRDFMDEAFLRESLVSDSAFSWVLGYEGISFYFNSDVNFPCGRQSVKVYVPFAEYPGLFVNQYTEVPKAYSCDILLDDSFAEEYYQTDKAEGRAKELLIYPAWDVELREYTGLNLMRDGELQTVPLQCDSLFGTIVHTSEGKDYLYVQTEGEDTLIHVYSFDPVLKELAQIPGRLPQHTHSSMMLSDTWFGNPDCFAVMAGDPEAYHTVLYRVGEDGIPEPLDLTGASLAEG